jgi:hypothetical protein
MTELDWNGAYATVRPQFASRLTGYSRRSVGNSYQGQILAGERTSNRHSAEVFWNGLSPTQSGRCPCEQVRQQSNR